MFSSYGRDIYISLNYKFHESACSRDRERSCAVLSVIHHEQQVLPTKVNSSSPYYFHRAGALQVRQGCIEVSSVEITAPGDVNEARDGLIAERATNSLFNLMLTVYFVTRHQVL